MFGSSWSNFLTWMAGGCALGLAVAFGVLVVIDPYGRLGIKKSREITFGVERLIKVTRALDPEFDSAIIGNSTSIALAPEHLTRLTGRKFVSLSISGTGPDASLSVARLFVDNHPNARTMVFGLDDTWCRKPGEGRPFPFWLYSSTSRYLLGLVTETSMSLLLSRWDTLEEQPRDGTQSYETGFIANGYGNVDLIRKNLARERYTAAELSLIPTNRLAEFVKSAPRPLSFVLLWTPRYINFVPAPGSQADQADRTCKASLAAALSGGRNVAIIDAAGEDRPENSDPANFFDFIHYRRSLGDLLEYEIAAAIANAAKQANAL
jgi:hypothetical protein